MRRWILKAGATNLDGLVLEDAPMPEPGEGEVRIRIHAVSLNYRDQLVLGGGFARLPDRNLVPVSDGAGEIDAVGSSVETWVLGDRVTNLFFQGWHDGPPKANLGFGLGGLDEDGMLSEYVVLPADRITRAPVSLDDAETATLPCAAVTAWNALYGDHPIGPDSKVLVLGSGGVSLFAMLFARAAGAQVFATSSQDAKLKRLMDFGASDGINYRDIPDWGKAVFERTGGVNKVINTVGTATLNQSLEAVAYGGEVALIGLMAFDDSSSGFGSLMGKSATVRGVAVGSSQMYEALAQAIDTHKVHPPIDSRFCFEDVKDAYRAQSSPELFGKIVIELS